MTVVDKVDHRHQGRITQLAFNANNGYKLTSTDNSGLICVWKYDKRAEQY